MSHGGDLFALGEGVASEPSFDIALRGYDKNQVNRYVTQVENDLNTLQAERDDALGQLQALAGQVQQLQLELNDAARRVVPSRVSFKHLGPRVEQILELAEVQATEIVRGAQQEIADQRAEAERLLADARERTALAVRDFDLALAARRAEEKKADEQRRADLAAETQKMRAEARDLLAHAQTDAQALRTAAAQEAAARRVQAEQDIAAAKAASDQRVAECDQRVAAGEQRLAAAGAELARAQAQLAAEREALQQAQQERTAAQDEIKQLQEKVKAAGTDFQQFTERLAELKAQLNTEVERLKKAQREAEEAERRKVELTKDAETLAADLAAKTSAGAQPEEAAPAPVEGTDQDASADSSSDVSPEADTTEAKPR